jgi:hypothetical protein
MVDKTLDKIGHIMIGLILIIGMLDIKVMVDILVNI